jgi:hypothetical protein
LRKRNVCQSENGYVLSLFQNSVSFGQALGKTGQKSGFSLKSKEAVPKTEVLEQPLLIKDIAGECNRDKRTSVRLNPLSAS